MVLLGGVGGTVENWVPVVANMSTDLHLIAVEMPGSGTTSCDPSRDLHILGHVERLKQFLRLLELDDRPVHLVGAATGGAVVGCFAAIYPDLVAKLTLICPVIRSPIDSDLIKMKKAGIENGLIVKSPDQIPIAMQLLSKNPKKFSKQILKGMFEIGKAKMKLIDQLCESMFEDVWLNETDRLLTPRLSQIKAPTLVIWGQFDRIVHVSGADVLRENLPNCVGVEILSSGHSIYMDDPKGLAKLIDDFAKGRVSP
jgi:abhydrolase domain-containing protein 6